MLDFDETGEIGNNIILLRKALGMTQEQLAFQANLSVSRLQDIEYGGTNTTVDTLLCISRTLGVDSRVLGVFLRPEKELLPAVWARPHLPRKPGGPLQFCENIVLLRKEEGLTQSQLAAMAGISTNCLRDIEHGCGNTTIETLAGITRVFGLSLLELAALTMTEEELLALVRGAKAAAWEVLV